jgi:hypothetical protein
LRDLIKKNKCSYLPSRQGNLLIVLPIIVCLLTAAFGISAFINLSNFNLKRVVLKQKSHEISEKVRARIRELIQTNQICSGYDFSLLKAANTIPVAPFTFDKTKLVGCFLTQEEVVMFKTVDLIVTRLARANDAALAQTMIQTQFNFVTDSSPIFTESVNRQILVGLVTPMTFAVILRGSGNTINLNPKSSFVVSGKTLVSNKGSSGIDFDNFALPPIFEKREGEVLFEDTLFQTAPAVSSSLFFNVETLLFHFRGGIQDGAFSGVTFGFDSMGAEWDQPLDYFYVYSEEGGYPLPGKIPNSAIGPFGYKPMNLSRASLKSFPDDATSPSGPVLKSLNQTCEASASSSEGSVRPMVYLNKSRDLNLDFKDSSVFCGLIVANVLNLKIPDGAEIAIYGHINVSKINIEGKGKVYIVNPYDFKSAPQKATLPSGASIQSLIPILDSLKTTVAHNFFVPIGNAPSAFSPQLMSKHFEVCGTSKCWKQYIESSDLSELYVANWYKNLKMMVIEAL